MQIPKSCYLIISAIVLILDQLTKEMIDRTLFVYETVPVIPGCFNLVHTRNTGAVFGLFQNASSPLLPWLLTLLSMTALVFITVYFFRLSRDDRMNLLGISMILGGAIGNMYDRIIRHSVVDFLEFYFKNYRWPAFNIADFSICVGIFLLILTSIREERRPLTSTSTLLDDGIVSR